MSSLFSRLSTALLAALLSVMLIPAHADVTLEFTQDEARAGEAKPVRFRVQGSTVRVDEGARGGAAYSLYDADSGTLTIVDAVAQSYMQMDREVIANMERYLREALKEQLQHLPEERQAQARRLLEEEAAREAPEGTLEALDETREVAGFTCQMHMFHLGGKPEQEMCMATRQTLEMSEANYGAMLGMIRVSQEMAAAAMSMGGPGSVPPELIKTLPIYTNALDAESPERFELQSISHGELEEELFSVPENYQQQKGF